VTPPLFPVGLVVEGRPCLVVGGGTVAARKVASLVACGARVTVVAPTVVDEVRGREVAVDERPYGAGDAARGYWLVIAATDDPSVNAQVFADAEAAGVWCNVVDDPAHCSVSLPAVARRGPVTVAVATDGASPTLAAELRDRVADRFLTPEVERLARSAGEVRRDLQAAGQPTTVLAWRDIVTSALDGGRVGRSGSTS
jgi:precorrin-2 dehydrogenase / sirohydrochlorin ferrochelatase